MRKRKPIFQLVHYDESALALWDACGEFIRRANDAVFGASFEPPALPDDALIMLPHSGIKNIRTGGQDRFNLGWPFVAVEIDDPGHPGERKERYFDPWYFVAMQLFALCGCKLALLDSKKVRGVPPRWYAEYQGRHQLRRIIADTPEGRDTRQRHPNAKRDSNGRSDAHYDYRKITFATLPKAAVRALDQLTRAKSRRREDAILSAVGMQQEQHEHHSRVGSAAPQFSTADFEERLREALAIADELHERLAKEWIAPATDKRSL